MSKEKEEEERLAHLKRLFDKGTSLDELIKIYVLRYNCTTETALELLREDIEVLYGAKRKSDKRTRKRAKKIGNEAYRYLSELQGED